MSALAIPCPKLPESDGFLSGDGLDPLSLSQAFAAFSSAAQSLERSYFSLGEEVRRLRHELEQERELRRRREALAEMSALLAHEVRNPVGCMELFAGLLAEADLGAQQREWVEQIQSGLRTLSATVDNVLEFHSPCCLVAAPTEIKAVLGSLQRLLAPAASRAGMQVLAELGREEIWVLADRQRLEQVFLNLALNAIRFAGSGGVLRIGARREPAMVQVAFEDNGPGIPEEIRGRIFDAGFTTRPGGPGIGLAVAKRIVEQHGGLIKVASSPTEGATFVLRLPLAGEPQ